MYFTDSRVSIDKRMEDGRTLLFPVTDPDYRQKRRNTPDKKEAIDMMLSKLKIKKR